MEEQIIYNCELIQNLLKQNPNRTIAVVKIDIDKCKIIEKGTNKLIYQGNTADTLQKLKDLLKPVSAIATENYKRIQEIVNEFPTGTITLERVDTNRCYIQINDGSYRFGQTSHIDRDIKEFEQMLINMLNKIKYKL